jgi:hypothetical protein
MAIKRIGKGFEFDKSLSKFEALKKDAPKVIAENSKNHFLEGFRKGGGQTDESKSGWEKRNARPKTVKRNAESPGKKISNLVLEGALRRAVDVLKATWNEIIVGTQRVEYAERHNEGLKGMPKREFIGDSKTLNEKNKKTLIKLMTRVFK